MSARSLALTVVTLALAACACPRPTRQEVAREEPAAPPPATVEVRSVALPGGEPHGNVVVLETIAPTEVNRAEEFTYTVRVTNTSPTLNLTDVVVTNHLPGEGFTYESSVPPASLAAEHLTWQVGDMSPGQVVDLLVRGRATQTGVLVNCGTVTYAPIACAATRVVAPDLALEKSAPAEVLVCDLIPVRLVVSNPGTGIARDVVVVDDLPAGWTVDGMTSVRFDVGALAAGESRELVYNAKASRTGEHTYLAAATASGDLRREASASTAVRQPVLRIAGTASSSNQILGRDTTFTLTLRNTGDASAQNLVVVDRLSGADQVVSVSDDGVASGDAIRWTLESLPPGGERTLRFVARRTSAGALAHAATAEAVCADAVSAGNETLYAGVPAVLLEVVDDPDPIVVGGTTTYTITVTNQGTAPATRISVYCDTDASVQILSGSGATAVEGTPASLRFEVLDTLAPKQTAEWKVVVRGTKPGDTRFKVVVNTAETERPIEETEATRFYE